MIVCVLGMHKSGTTLVAETLHHSGIDMGEFDTRLGYDDKNTYERHETLDLNRELLAAATIPTREGVRRRRLERDRAGYQPNTDTASFVLRRKLASVVATTDVGPFRRLADELSAAHPRWGFKDPRTCLTYEVWRRALPGHRVVAVFRPFDEVLSRYKLGWSSPIRLARLVRSWIVHNELLVEHLRSRDDYLLMRYDALMSGSGELERLGTYLDHPITDRRNPDMYRARVERRDARPNPPFALPNRVIDRIAGIETELDELRDGQHVGLVT